MEFWFNLKSCKLFNLTVKESNHLSKAQKRIELVHIPGRSDELIVSDGCRDNLKVEVVCNIDGSRNKSLKQLSDDIDLWINGHEGYKVLEFDDGTKFLAVFIGQLDIKKIVRNFAEVKLIFSCKEYKEER